MYEKIEKTGSGNQFTAVSLIGGHAVQRRKMLSGKMSGLAGQECRIVQRTEGDGSGGAGSKEIKKKIENLRKIPEELQEKPSIGGRIRDYVYAGATGSVTGVVTEALNQNFRPAHENIKTRVPMGKKRKGIKTTAHAIGTVKFAGLVPGGGQIAAAASGLEAGLSSYATQVDKTKAAAIGLVNFGGALGESFIPPNPVTSVTSAVTTVVGGVDSVNELAELIRGGRFDPYPLFAVADFQLVKVAEIHREILSSSMGPDEKRKLLDDLDENMRFLIRQIRKTEKRTKVSHTSAPGAAKAAEALDSMKTVEAPEPPEMISVRDKILRDYNARLALINYSLSHQRETTV